MGLLLLLNDPAPVYQPCSQVQLRDAGVGMLVILVIVSDALGRRHFSCRHVNLYADIDRMRSRWMSCCAFVAHVGPWGLSEPPLSIQTRPVGRRPRWSWPPADLCCIQGARRQTEDTQTPKHVFRSSEDTVNSTVHAMYGVITHSRHTVLFDLSLTL
jgi:hypothetical protein